VLNVQADGDVHSSRLGGTPLRPLWSDCGAPPVGSVSRTITRPNLVHHRIVRLPRASLAPLVRNIDQCQSTDLAPVRDGCVQRHVGSVGMTTQMNVSSERLNQNPNCGTHRCGAAGRCVGQWIRCHPSPAGPHLHWAKRTPIRLLTSGGLPQGVRADKALQTLDFAALVVTGKRQTPG
jgi:hypothetical protein